MQLHFYKHFNLSKKHSKQINASLCPGHAPVESLPCVSRCKKQNHYVSLSVKFETAAIIKKNVLKIKIEKQNKKHNTIYRKRHLCSVKIFNENLCGI